VIAIFDAIKDSSQIVKSFDVHRDLGPDFLIAWEARKEMRNQSS
jgi:hypothetical protein